VLLDGPALAIVAAEPAAQGPARRLGIGVADDLGVAYDGGGVDGDLALWHLGAAQVEHHVAADGQRRQGSLDPPAALPSGVADDGDDPLAVGTLSGGRRGRRRAGRSWQVGRNAASSPRVVAV
jgi:hypothetical protein